LVPERRGCRCRQRQRVRRRPVFHARLARSAKTLCAKADTADVINVIQQQSQQVTAGQVGIPPAPDSQDFQYTINVEGRLSDPAEFANIIVKSDSQNGGQITRVKDVGRVELGAQTYSQVSKLNGKPAAGVAFRSCRPPTR